MTITIKLAIHLALCAGLLATVMLRLHRTDDRTFDGVRLAFILLAVAAIAGLLAPFAWRVWPWVGRFHIHWTAVLMEAGILAVQLSTARHWRSAVPAQFCKPDAAPAPITAPVRPTSSPRPRWLPPAPKGPAP